MSEDDPIGSGMELVPAPELPAWANVFANEPILKGAVQRMQARLRDYDAANRAHADCLEEDAKQQAAFETLTKDVLTFDLAKEHFDEPESLLGLREFAKTAPPSPQGSVEDLRYKLAIFLYNVFLGDESSDLYASVSPNGQPVNAVTYIAEKLAEHGGGNPFILQYLDEHEISLNKTDKGAYELSPEWLSFFQEFLQHFPATSLFEVKNDLKIDISNDRDPSLRLHGLTINAFKIPSHHIRFNKVTLGQLLRAAFSWAHDPFRVGASDEMYVAITKELLGPLVDADIVRPQDIEGLFAKARFVCKREKELFAPTKRPPSLEENESQYLGELDFSPITESSVLSNELQRCYLEQRVEETTTSNLRAIPKALQEAWAGEYFLNDKTHVDGSRLMEDDALFERARQLRHSMWAWLLKLPYSVLTGATELKFINSILDEPVDPEVQTMYQWCLLAHRFYRQGRIHYESSSTEDDKRYGIQLMSLAHGLMEEINLLVPKITTRLRVKEELGEDLTVMDLAPAVASLNELSQNVLRGSTQQAFQNLAEAHALNGELAEAEEAGRRAGSAGYARGERVAKKQI